MYYRRYYKISVLLFAVFIAQAQLFDGDKIKEGRALQEVVTIMVQKWSKDIGIKLSELSGNMTREKEVVESFKPLENKLIKQNGTQIVQSVAKKIEIMMKNKSNAVQEIAEFAEFLSYHRNDSLSEDTNYYFFDADDIKNNDANWTRQVEIANDILELECLWCYQTNNNTLPNNIYSDETRRKNLFKRRKKEGSKECACDTWPKFDYVPSKRSSWLPMVEDERFDEKVNLNLSIAKIARNVYEREQGVMEGLRWSEPLDLVFKENFAKDPTLTWQYFASPRGFMRHYPAVKWSDERYFKTYDFRTRTWYTEAITSPKDIIILLDRSGSMRGTRRAMSMQIVNQILDTLNDNDFVNVYTFTNTTEPLVDCFSDTLVQANEENLRLLRENLPVYKSIAVADLTIGFKKAFEILETFRAAKTSARCNQAIMIITEGIDYWYDTDLFKHHNYDKKFPVRIFAYQIGDSISDAKELKLIACSNMGYWANITDMGDIREKMLKYLNVMSRPINYNRDKKNKPEFIWSYLHVDLVDRRLSNWLWKKYEGIRQRRVFLDHMKRNFERQGLLFTSPNHVLLQESYDYEKYEKKMKYKYMTTVSLPVYGRRPDEVELIGVAGIDVPIKLFKDQIPFDHLGVNGYAFIVTNNGYILMHPDHRTQFKKILKPTFNRVDFVEVEILDDDEDPRMFGKSIIELREKLVNQDNLTTVTSLNVKYLLHEMKRLMLAKRHYFYQGVGPFTLGIVLPDKYGFDKVNKADIKALPRAVNYQNLLTNNWKAHPDWVYSPKQSYRNWTAEKKVRRAFSSEENSDLLKSFLYDLNLTKWFNEEIDAEDKFTSEYIVHKTFLATHSGLFRWKTLINVTESDQESFEDRNSQAIDEDWYRRAVEMNFKNDSIYIYSVPFQTSGYEDNTLITSTKAIFVEKDNMKTPVAVVGLQFNHNAMYKLFNATTKYCYFEDKPCPYTCESDYLNCFILDNNAYVVLSDEPEFIGRYMGDIKPYIMSRLTAEHVYVQKKMYDYQAICQFPPPPKNDTEDVQYEVYVSAKKEMKMFEDLRINKTFPTPCDHQMWLYNLNETKTFPFDPYHQTAMKFECDWPFVVDRIPNSNLLFLATNGVGSCNRPDKHHKSPDPREIVYNANITERSGGFKNGEYQRRNDLPCYIATMNSYTRRMYMKCHNRHEKEDALTGNWSYCGHYWK